MNLCPNATLVVNWFMVERMGKTLESPPTRWRWVGDGESLDVGDRTLQAIRPPIFDSPTTRGLFDPTTGVYWGSDSFATPMLTPAINVTELDTGFWLDGMAMFGQYVSPWLELVDDAKFQRTVDRVAELAPTVLVGCHTPAVTGANVDHAIANTRRVPGAEVPPQPDQQVLEAIQSTFVTA
jgi:flavorubredoxin